MHHAHYRAAAVREAAVPSRIPRIGTERWRWYGMIRDRQKAWSRMHFSVIRRLLQMAIVCGGHAAVVFFFSEKCNVATYSAFGTFDGAIKVHDVLQEYEEHHKPQGGSRCRLC